MATAIDFERLSQAQPAPQTRRLNIGCLGDIAAYILPPLVSDFTRFAPGDVAMVFQKPTLLPWFDVLGNVTFPIRHRKGRVDEEDRQNARKLLTLVGLTDFEHQRIDELSGGMQ